MITLLPTDADRIAKLFVAVPEDPAAAAARELGARGHAAKRRRRSAWVPAHCAAIRATIPARNDD